MSSSAHACVAVREGASLPYTLRRSRRRTLGLYVYPDGRLEVRVPLHVDAESVERFVLSRWDWIARQQAKFAARPRPRPLEYVQGGLHPLLGVLYPLHLQAASRGEVALREGVLCVAGPDIDQPERVAARLTAWYRAQAQGVFHERLEQGHAAMAHYGIPLPALKIRRMKSRWGSCSHRGAVTLNLELIKFPLDCLDYVIAHELCHLLEFNHSPRFYALMDAVMPDWRERRRRLNSGAPEHEVD